MGFALHDSDAGERADSPQLGRIVDHITVARTLLIITPGLTLACWLMSISTSVVLLGLTIYLLRLFG